jgi:hypothetical protein
LGEILLCFSRFYSEKREPKKSAKMGGEEPEEPKPGLGPGSAEESLKEIN